MLPNGRTNNRRKSQPLKRNVPNTSYSNYHNTIPVQFHKTADRGEKQTFLERDCIKTENPDIEYDTSYSPLTFKMAQYPINIVKKEISPFMEESDSKRSMFKYATQQESSLINIGDNCQPLFNHNNVKDELVHQCGLKADLPLFQLVQNGNCFDLRTPKDLRHSVTRTSVSNIVLPQPYTMHNNPNNISSYGGHVTGRHMRTLRRMSQTNGGLIHVDTREPNRNVPLTVENGEQQNKTVTDTQSKVQPPRHQCKQCGTVFNYPTTLAEHVNNYCGALENLRKAGKVSNIRRASDGDTNQNDALVAGKDVVSFHLSVYQ